MSDGLVSMAKVCTWSLWAAVVALIVMAAILTSMGYTGAGDRFGDTACITSAAAAVSTIRVYCLRVCAEIRACAAENRPAEMSVRRL